MSGRRLVVIEANEIPPRVLRWYAEACPRSAIAGLLRADQLIETANHDEPDLDRALYPSQAWATLGTGVGFAQHGVYWYGDPKPAQFPLYWQYAASQGKRVGIVGTLHSSPASEQAVHDNVVFALPDCFASDPDTRPTRYRALQRMNLAMTRRSGRVASVKPTLRDVLALANAPLLGLRPSSLAELARLGLAVARGVAPRERLRVAQFLLMGDVFRRLVRTHDPDLAVVFTNHVAAAMHRYWAATFPDDWTVPPYSQEWIDRYEGEVRYAMDRLDRFIADVIDICDRTDRALIVCTAIGQRADLALTTTATDVAVVRDAARFVESLGIPGDFELRSAMVPQIGVAFADEPAAQRAANHVEQVATTGVAVRADRASNVVTISYHFEPNQDAFAVGGRRVSYDAAGVAVERTDVQRCAVHDRIGSLLVHGVPSIATDGAVGAVGAVGADGAVDVRSVAPAILDLLGIEPPPWHDVRQVRFERDQLVVR